VTEAGGFFITLLLYYTASLLHCFFITLLLYYTASSFSAGKLYNCRTFSRRSRERVSSDR